MPESSPTPTTAPFYDLRPKANILRTLIRAALYDDGRGGPWLTIARNRTPGEQVLVYTHHLSCLPVHWATGKRMVMLTGDDALAYITESGWPAEQIPDPDPRHLRELGTYAVTLRDVPGWDLAYDRWMATYCGHHELHVAVTRKHRDQAERMRTAVAEQWLMSH